MPRKKKYKRMLVAFAELLEEKPVKPKDLDRLKEKIKKAEKSGE